MWIEKTAKTTSHFHFIFYVLSQVTLYFFVLFNLLPGIINTSICRDYTVLPKICFSNLNYTFSLPNALVPSLSHAYLSSLQFFFFFFFWSEAHEIFHILLSTRNCMNFPLSYTWQRAFSALYCLLGKPAIILPVPAAPPGLRPQFGDVSIFSFFLFPISFCCSPRIPPIPTFA